MIDYAFGRLSSYYLRYNCRPMQRSREVVRTHLTSAGTDIHGLLLFHQSAVILAL